MDRTQMLAYLKNHFRYYTMNSWNLSTSYAVNVKVPKLNIPAEHEDVAYELASGMLVSDEFEAFKQDMFLAFADRTGYDIGFNGRSSGYIVLYQTAYENGVRRTYPGRSIDADPDELDDMTLEELADRYGLVKDFDDTVEAIAEKFRELCKRYTESGYERIAVNRVEHLYDRIPVENLKAGDQVIGADGKPHKVLRTVSCDRATAESEENA